MRRWLAILALLLLTAPPVLAITSPNERLDDPALEARARDVSKQLRCVVCQNQSIDDSNAPLARDLRVLVRERILAGDTDRELMSYVTARYGDFVLLKPPVRSSTWLLWYGPLVVVLAGGLGIALWMRRQRRGRVLEPLSAEESAEIARLLEERS